jgi:predicted nucleic acid-binding Zn ribbon protein
MQRFSDPPLETCEQCGQPVKKLISNTSFVLKGSGWYVTDYGKSGSSAAKSDDGKSEKKSETKTETKSDTSACATAPCGNCPTA